MSEHLQPTPEPVEQAPLVVDVSNATPDDRLAVLYAAYPQAKAAADSAAADLKAITDGIKLELTSLSPDIASTPRFELRGAAGIPLRLAWQVTRRFDTKRFQREQAAVYETYRTTSGSWVLSAIKGSE